MTPDQFAQLSVGDVFHHPVSEKCRITDVILAYDSNGAPYTQAIVSRGIDRVGSYAIHINHAEVANLTTVTC